MAPSRAMKRTRADDRIQNFWDDDQSDTGTYLLVRLRSGQTLKSRGWPYVQQCIRGILGAQKVQKASFQSDGSLLLKTTNDTQTEKLLKATHFGAEECEVLRDARLNRSRGTIHAYDLIELSEEEVVGWLKDFGVVAAKRFMRTVGGHTENTPTLLLTFNRPTCPNKLEFDYITYHVRRHIPNPLICHKCGRFGHTEVRCRADAVCLNCGGEKHDGQCQAKCISCGNTDHSCRSRQCSVWKKEREICELKVEKDISYAHARRLYQENHQTPVMRPYAAVVRSPSEAPNQDTVLRDRVEKLEQKVDRMLTLLDKLVAHQETSSGSAGPSAGSSTPGPSASIPTVPQGTMPEDAAQHDDDTNNSQMEMTDSDLPLSGFSGTLQAPSSGEHDPSADLSSSNLGSWGIAGRKGKHSSIRTHSQSDGDTLSTVSPQLGERKHRLPDGKQGRQMPSLTRGTYPSKD